MIEPFKYIQENVNHFLDTTADEFPVERPEVYELLLEAEKNDLCVIVVVCPDTGAHYITACPRASMPTDNYPIVHVIYGATGKDESGMPRALFGDHLHTVRFPVFGLIEGKNHADGYTVYQHGLDFWNSWNDTLYYTGLTKHRWKSRWKQHLHSAMSGRSNTLFHAALRAHAGSVNSSVVTTILGTGLTKDEAMAIEEKCVDRDSLYPAGLNMIPGGYKGLAYLHEHRLVKGSLKDSQNIETIINRSMKTAKREGKPNPLLAARMRQDDELISKLVLARPDTFDADELREIRYMGSLGKSVDEIADRIGYTRDHRNIAKVLAGKTYSRVLTAGEA